MSIVSYAQNFEDVMLWRALHDVQDGRYLDIGAQDPVIDSVSLSFYRAGWRGVHVEATPAYVELLRSARPDETVIQAAVTDAEGMLRFFAIDGTGISTGVPTIAARHRTQGYESAEINVPTTRLDQLLEMMDGDVHWLKIDVEGMEADVLRSWGTSERRPWILVIESASPLTQIPTEGEWIGEVRRRGYSQVFFDGLNRFFVHEAHKKLRRRFSTPANVFDGFGITKHHFAASLLRSELEDRERHAREDEAARHRGEIVHLQGTTQELQQALNETHRMLDLSHVEQGSLSRQLVTATQEHHAVVETLWRDRRESEEALRLEFRKIEGQLVEALRLATTSESAARVELARLEERILHALERAERAEIEVDSLRSRLAESQQLGRDANTQADRIRQDLQTVTRQREHANFLIRSYLAERQSRWSHLGHFIGLPRRSTARMALAAWLSTSDQPTIAATLALSHINPEAGETMPSPAHLDARNPYLRADSLPELLSWHDVDFVRCAYVTVLGRQPDPEGERYYTARLRRGFSKFGILWQLRKSEEGPNHDPGIAGFDKELRKHRNARTPIVGWLVGWFTGRETNSRHQRQLRAIANMIGALPNQLPQASASREISDSLERLHQTVRDLTFKVEDLAKHGLAVAAGYTTDGSGRSEDRMIRGRLSPASRKLFDKICAR